MIRPVLAITLVLGMLASVAVAAAQHSTPGAEDIITYPAHIRSGTCNAIGDRVFELEPVSSTALGATPQVDLDDPGHGNVIARSQSTVETSLGTLAAEDHVISVQGRDTSSHSYVACGEIAGDLEGGELIIELTELGASGVTGQAIVEEQDDGAVDVTITLVDAEGQEGATPTA